MPEGYRKRNQTAKSPGLRNPTAFTDDLRNRGQEQSRKLWEDSIFKCNGSFQSFLSISFPMYYIALGKRNTEDLEEKFLVFEFSKSGRRRCQVCVWTSEWSSNRNAAQVSED